MSYAVNSFATRSPVHQNDESAKALYFSLQGNEIGDHALEQARQFLKRQLATVRDMPTSMPNDIRALPAWIARNTERTGSAYQQYLAARKCGAPRRYFHNKAHALYFLKTVAPTKLVDGAWMYGLLTRWNDIDFVDLIRIYLEELGDGVSSKNHVVLYRKLLETYGCEQWQALDNTHFIQGAIQLTLGYDAEHFLPELIGYNLGYEQLPLHLMITAYELNELGIDPYYFTLHITVDNSVTGHAHKALQGLQNLMPRVGDAAAFYRRVMDGYKLNDLGANTTSVIASFDLQRELVSILATKSTVGKHMHSDYCRIGGRTINDWLASPASIPELLHKFQTSGWIKRGEDPENSRFWRLIQSERAEMFGVFTEYEQQILHDWIAMAPPSLAASSATAATPHIVSHRARRKALDAIEEKRGETQQRHDFRQQFKGSEDSQGYSSELRLLEQKLQTLNGKEEVMRYLISLMSPANHHTASGLMATRIYSELLG